MIPAYFPMKKNKFCSRKNYSFINPFWVLIIRFERFDSVFDLPVDPEPVQTMTGIEPIRIRPLDCSMLRMVSVWPEID